MNSYSKFLASTLIGLSAMSVHADGVFPIKLQRTTFSQCPIIATDNALDVAILSDGYFVLSKHHKNSPRYFSRYGMLMLDAKGYIVSASGHYVLRMNDAKDPNHLSKIQIPTDVMKPKATENVEMSLNLYSGTESSYEFSYNIYDSLSALHQLTLMFTHTSAQQWQVNVKVDEQLIAQGQLDFNNDGTFKSEQNLSHILWDNGELNINLSDSSQFGSPSEVSRISQDGYPLGHLSGFNVNENGVMQLIYSNGHHKDLPGRIAIAKFLNPKFLEKLDSHIYKPTEKSGQPMIHWLNSDGVIVDSALEEDECQ